jgi:hypothetical protein
MSEVNKGTTKRVTEDDAFFIGSLRLPPKQQIQRQLQKQ